MEKYQESLVRARRSLKTAEHMTFVSYPMLNEKRLLLKILEELADSLISSINAVLQFDHIKNKTRIYGNAQENFQLFKRISGAYGLSETETKKIEEILSIAEKHKKSSFEFVKNDTIVIMADGFATEAITIDKIRKFFIETRMIFEKFGSKII